MTQGIGIMKKILILLALASSVYAQTMPMSPVSIDCRYATHMTIDLERIIKDPSNSNSSWDRLFASVAGSQTDHQRVSSAKVILWTIRTQCVGY